AQSYQQYCQPCHGADRRGVPGGLAPALVDVTDRLSEDTIRAAVTGGRGTMPPVSSMTAEDLTAVIAYLATPLQGGRRAVVFGPPPPPGPVVASGGAPLPVLRIPQEPPRSYGGIGGNGGNIPYPEGIDVPPVRYVSEYGVLASATKPPYTTLTAYDLNA